MLRPRKGLGAVAAALAVAASSLLAACGGDSGRLSDASVRPEVPEGVAIDPETPPDLLADKETGGDCDGPDGIDDAAFVTAFCLYRDAALAATSGPDGVTGIDPSLLAAGDEAVARFASDPTGAIDLLEAATASLG